jgi:uncharacterized protein (TIGR02611 family)
MKSSYLVGALFNCYIIALQIKLKKIIFKLYLIYSYSMKTLKRLKRIIIIVIGFTVLFIGILLLILPGPAFVVIPIGLAILATEFVWARNLLDKIKSKIKRNNKNNIE